MHKRQLFETPINQFFQKINDDIRAEIHQESNTYLVQVDEDAYVKSLVEKHSLVPFELGDDLEGINQREVKGSPQANMFGDVVTPTYVEYDFELSYSGYELYWDLSPTSARVMRFDADVDLSSIRFTIRDWNNNAAQLKVDLERTRENIRFNVSSINSDIMRFNSSIEGHVRAIFHARKSELLKRSEILVSLGIPMRKKDTVPETATVPVKPLARKVYEKPRVTTGQKPSIPDPMLSNEMYQDILKTIHDLGKVMERLPSLYRDKDENEIRDQVLLYLEPRFDSAGGETFNKQGKTDILIKHDRSNLFIAEFKFWGGSKLFRETIEQLYRYLTWRDSKAAIVVLNKNKDQSAVIDTIKQDLQNHELYVETKGEMIDETWINVVMKFPDDSKKTIQLAVLILHTPPVG